MIILNVCLILLILYVKYIIKPKEEFINLTVNIGPAPEEELTHEQVLEREVANMYSFKEYEKFSKKYLKDQKELANLITNPEIDKEIRSGCDLICKGGYANLSPDFWN